MEKSLKNVVGRTDSAGIVSQSLKGELILVFCYRLTNRKEVSCAL